MYSIYSIIIVCRAIIFTGFHSLSTKYYIIQMPSIYALIPGHFFSKRETLKPRLFSHILAYLCCSWTSTAQNLGLSHIYIPTVWRVKAGNTRTCSPSSQYLTGEAIHLITYRTTPLWISGDTSPSLYSRRFHSFNSTESNNQKVGSYSSILQSILSKRLTYKAEGIMWWLKLMMKIKSHVYDSN